MRSRFLMMLATVFLTASVMFAAPYSGETMTLRQPDGSLIDVKGWGDEYYMHIESLDGYTLTSDNGWATYANISPNKEELISTGVRYMNTTSDMTKSTAVGLNLQKSLRVTNEKMMQTAKSNRQRLNPDSIDLNQRFDFYNAPLSGDVTGLTILVDFSDDEATITQSQINDFLNLEGYTGYGNNGSVRDYYYDVSSDKLIYTNGVTAYYRASQPKSYYNDANIAQGIRVKELINEALNHFDDQGLDFSQFSVDSSDNLLALNVYYAGARPSVWATGLWPHQSAFIGDGFSADGVTVRNYQITDISASLSLRTFCHENGHMICGWPDLYDYDYDSEGVGNFCIMSGGGDSKNPVPPCSYLRVLKEWDVVVDVTVNGGSFVDSSNSYKTYLFRNEDNSSEYFLVESRLQTGRNIYLPDDGVAVWHIDEDGDRDSQQMLPNQHYVVSLEQADGEFDLEYNNNTGDSDDLYNTDDVFNDTSTPDAKWWNGTASGLIVKDITIDASSISFSIGEAQASPSYISASDNRTDGIAVSWASVSGATHYRIARSLNASGSGAILGAWYAGTAFVDTGATLGVIYYYWVQAANSNTGRGASPWEGPNQGCRALSTPSYIRASDGTRTDGIAVSWTSVRGATHYRIARSVNASGSGVTFGGWYAGTSFVDTTVTPGVTYYYWVQAASSSSGTGASDWRGYNSGYRKLSSPSYINASDGTDSDKIVVNWGAVSGATHYRIARSTNSSGSGYILGSWTSVRSFNDTSASPGVTYYYWVQAAKSSSGAGASGWRGYNSGFRRGSSADPYEPTSTATQFNLTSYNGRWLHQIRGKASISAYEDLDIYKVYVPAGRYNLTLLLDGDYGDLDLYLSESVNVNWHSLSAASSGSISRSVSTSSDEEIDVVLTVHSDRWLYFVVVLYRSETSYPIPYDLGFLFSTDAVSEVLSGDETQKCTIVSSKEQDVPLIKSK